MDMVRSLVWDDGDHLQYRAIDHVQNAMGLDSPTVVREIRLPHRTSCYNLVNQPP